MSEIISKELLSEVLDSDIYDKGMKSEKILEYATNHTESIAVERFRNINIYELAHKCKKWAFEQGYDIDSFVAGCDIVESNTRKKVFEIIEQDRRTKKRMYNPENEIKACQWILENQTPTH